MQTCPSLRTLAYQRVRSGATLAAILVKQPSVNESRIVLQGGASEVTSSTT